MWERIFGFAPVIFTPPAEAMYSKRVFTSPPAEAMYSKRVFTSPPAEFKHSKRRRPRNVRQIRHFT